ncbi:MAG: hypothetical protein HOY71_01970 [Nonomuraea sp.]|nr:hypothetical protein [Nonomuraea sp.]
MGVLSAVVVVVVAWQTGLVVPRLSLGADTGSGGTYATRDLPPVYEPRLELVNDGLLPETVEAVGQSVPGMRLLEVAVASPELEPGGSTDVTLRYLVTDCAAVPAGSLPVPVRVRRWWGDVTTQAGYDENYSGSAWHRDTVADLCRQNP